MNKNNIFGQIKTVLKYASDFFVDVIFPRALSDCLLNELTLADLEYCQRAEKHSAYSAVFSYKDPLIRHIIWSLKFNSNLEAAKLLGDILADRIIEDAAEEIIFSKENRILLVPIPSSTKRLLQRGFNPPDVICENIVEKSDKTFELGSENLKKVKETERQASLSKRKDRENNIKDCFIASNVEGRHIILIDDVFTSGATFKNAKRALKQAGARKVTCYAIAH